jgi:hypothetical protein
MHAKVVLAALLVLSGAGSAMANVDPMIRKRGQESIRESTFGTLTDRHVDKDGDMGIDGAFDEGGKLFTKENAKIDRFEGVWTTPKGDEECKSAQQGSKYWGKIWFKLSEFGRVVTGKWGYCDNDPDQDFKAEWKKP